MTEPAELTKFRVDFVDAHSKAKEGIVRCMIWFPSRKGVKVWVEMTAEELERSLGEKP